MKRWQFILAMRQLGYSDDLIREVLELREREREEGVERRWRDYLPEWWEEEPK